MSRRPLAIRFLASMAWRNLWRHKRRSLITAVAMSVGMALCMATIAFSDGMFDLLFHVMVEQQLGHVQVHHPDYPGARSMYDTLPEAEALLEEVEGTEGVEAAAGRVMGFGLLGGEKTTVGGQLVGVDPVRELRVTPLGEQLVRGEMLSDTPAHEAVLGYKLAEEIEVDVGGTLLVVTQGARGSLGNDLYTVTGIFKSGNAGLDRSGAILHLADLQALLELEDQVHRVTVLTTGDIPATVDRLRDAVAGPETEVEPWQEASPQTAELMAMRDVSSFVVLGLVFVVAAFGVMNTMMMSVFERTRELGVLKAIGLRPNRMVGLILFESLFLAAVATAIGLVLGGLLDWYLVVYGLDFSGEMSEPLTFNGIALDPVFKGAVRVQGIVWVVLAVFVVSLFASLFPAWRAARLAPVDAIRTE